MLYVRSYSGEVGRHFSVPFRRERVRTFTK